MTLQRKMTPGENHPNPLDDEDLDEHLGALINEYFDRRQSGENLSPEDFLAQHGEHASALREHFAGLDLLGGVGSSRGPALGGDATRPAFEGSSARCREAITEPAPPEIPGYEIIKLVGRGGMGLVYKAIQRSTQREVALKVLLEGPLASEQSRRRFEREIALAAQLKHPHIIPIYDSGSHDGRMYYAMEYVRGSALSDYLNAHKLGVKATLRLFNAICEAIRHAHQRGVVHRDLKPSNILVDSEGTPHILDFGLAKAGTYADTKTSVTAQIIGTPAYMSPEQAAGDPSGIDVRTDVYSLGVVLYEGLTGRMPYETNVGIGKLLENIAQVEPVSPSTHNKKVDGEVSAIVMKALEKNKDLRYQSLDALSSDITRYLAGEPISVKPASGLYLLKKALWKHRLTAGITAALVILAAGVSLTIRHFVAEVNERESRIRRQNEQLVAQAAEKDRLQKDAEALQQQRDAAEQRRAAYEALAQRLDPKLAEALRTLTGGLGPGTGPAQILPELLAQTATSLRPDSADAPPKKDLGLDLDDMRLLSRRPPAPTGAPAPPKTEAGTETLDEFLERLRWALERSRRRQAERPQPATTQPAADPPKEEPDADSSGG